MAATLAHEINQPLAAIANYAAGCVNLLDDGGASTERLHEGLSEIAAAAERAGKLISRLRTMTKRTTPASEVFDLSMALDEAVQMVRAGGCDDVAIELQCDPALLVHGDKLQVQQVIINLLRNACHAAAPKRLGRGGQSAFDEKGRELVRRDPGQLRAWTCRLPQGRPVPMDRIRRRPTAWELACPSAGPSPKAIPGPSPSTIADLRVRASPSACRASQAGRPIRPTIGEKGQYA